MERMLQLLNGMGINISPYQAEMLGYILSNTRRDVKDGTASKQTPLYFTPRTTATKSWNKLEAALIGLTPRSEICITTTSNQEAELIWRYLEQYAKRNSSMKANM